MQDRAIIEIGKINGNASSMPHQDFIGNMFPGKNYDMILAVFGFLTADEGVVCSFEKIDVEKVSEKNDVFQRYAYRKGSARGGDITFTTKFGDIDKKFNTFYPKQVNDVISFAEKLNEEGEVKIFKALKLCLQETGDEVKSRLQKQYESLDKAQQQSSGFSIRFEGLDGKTYLEDFLTIQKTLNQDGTSGKSEKYNVVSEGHDETCSICLAVKSVLHGFASPFKYATVDKTGLVSGFFDQKNNWKNYPICSDCALYFEFGKNFVSQHLSKYFYGKSYYMIPKTIVGANPTLLKKALEKIEELDYNENEGEKIESKEEYLLRRIGKEDGDHNQFSLSLLFYEENPTTKAIKIKLFLEEVFPSTFRKLFLTVPKIVNKNPLYKDAITIKKEKEDLRFSFGILKTFFETDFYEIVQTVFLELALSENVLFSKFMIIVRANYNRSQTSDGFVEPRYWTVLKAHMTLAYLRELNIIPKNKSLKIMEAKDDEVLQEQDKKQSAFDTEKFMAFINGNHDFFDLDSGYRAGIFSVGVLVRQVFNLQSANLDGNTPFEKKLNGFNMSAERLKGIYLEALDKISSYTSFHAYQGLRNVINEYFILNSHKLSQISNNELSFYFVAGLEFGNQFKTQKSN